jgi:hypothetical protein
MDVVINKTFFYIWIFSSFLIVPSPTKLLTIISIRSRHIIAAEFFSAPATNQFLFLLFGPEAWFQGALALWTTKIKVRLAYILGRFPHHNLLTVL